MVSPVLKSQFISELQDQSPVSTVFLVKFSALANDRNSKPYLNLILMDRSGEIEARIWDQVPHYVGQVIRDSLVWVEGKCQIYQNRKQILIHSVRLLREDEVSLETLLPEGMFDPDLLYKKLTLFIHSMKDPYYRALAQAVLLEDEEIIDRLKRAPAAKSIHHAYRGGLLEHIVSMTGLFDFISKHYVMDGNPLLDRDLLFLGGFFHDIGKLWELTYERAVDYTTEGRLIGHLVMGVELVEKKIKTLEATPGKLPTLFPQEKRLLVKHLILSHHGKLEYGSPKEPQCLEAVVVHLVDDLDSKINTISRFISSDSSHGRWTALNKTFGRFFYKPETGFDFIKD